MKFILASFFLFLSCNNSTARLWNGDSAFNNAPAVSLDPINLVIGTSNNVSGTCSPNGSFIEVTCDGAPSAAVECIYGSYTAINVEVLALPVTCKADLTSEGGVTVSDSEPGVEPAQCASPAGLSATKYNDIGDGVAVSSAWEIYNATQLDDMQQSGGINDHYILCEDIDMTGFTNVMTSFTGDFNGNNKKISDYTNSAVANIGIFQSVDGAKIYDLTLEDFTITVTDSAAATGALIGSVANGGVEITNITTEGITINGGGGVGILIGSINAGGGLKLHKGLIKNSEINISTNSGSTGLIGSALVADLDIDDVTFEYFNTIAAVPNAGRSAVLLGYSINLKEVLINNIKAKVGINISGKEDIGGLIGFGNFGADFTISNIDLKASIVASGDTTGNYIGGLMGRLTYNSAAVKSGIIENVLVDGSVDGTVLSKFAAGMIGSTKTTGASIKSLIIRNSTIKADVIGGLFARTGGVLGELDVADSTTVIIDNVDSQGDVNCHTGTNTIGACGGFIGDFFGNSTVGGVRIINSSSSGTITSSHKNDVGGFVGRMWNNSEISSSIASGNINCAGFCGGFVGSTRNDSLIDDCEATGNVTSNGNGSATYIGGFVGFHQHFSVIEDSMSSGDVIAPGLSTGGFAGGSNAESKILASEARGNVSATGSGVGGFIGQMYVGSPVIKDSIALGNVTATEETNVGGFVGAAEFGNDGGSIERSYSQGSVIGEKGCGGFAGSINGDDFRISDSFSTGDVICTRYRAGGFLGLQRSSDRMIVERSFSTGNVTAQELVAATVGQIGGFVGVKEDGADLIIRDSYSTGDVDVSLAPSHNNVGGFIGIQGGSGPLNVVENSYSLGNVLTGTVVGECGGFIGRHSASAANGFVRNNFSIGDSCQNSATNTDFFIGFYSGGVAFTDNFYIAATACNGTPCDGSVGGSSEAAVANFQDSSGALSATLFNTWDFVNTWEDRSALNLYPKLRCPAAATAAFCTAWNAAQ